MFDHNVAMTITGKKTWKEFLFYAKETLGFEDDAILFQVKNAVEFYQDKETDLVLELTHGMTSHLFVVEYGGRVGDKYLHRKILGRVWIPVKTVKKALGLGDYK